MKSLVRKITLALSVAGIVQMAYASTDSRPNSRSMVYQEGEQTTGVSDYPMIQDQDNSNTLPTAPAQTISARKQED